MIQTSYQIEHFRDFALARLSSTEQHLTIDELYDEWRLLNPDTSQMANDTIAVAASLHDYQSGVLGKNGAEIIQMLKSQLGQE